MPQYPRPEGSRAVLIGTSQYDNYENLPAIDNNLKELSSVLTSAKRGGFRAEHCHVISNPRDAKVLASHVAEVARQATDVLFVYFAGHGIIDESPGRKLQLALRRTEPQQVGLHYTALSMELLRQSIAVSPAAIKVLVLESCFSGLAIDGSLMSEVGDLLQQQADLGLEGVYTLTSSSRFEVSIAPPGAKFTAFCEVFIGLLREPPGNYPAGATLVQMFPLLRSRLQVGNYPAPQQSIGNGAGDLALVGWDVSGSGDHDMPVVLISPPAEDASGSLDLAGPEHKPAMSESLGSVESDQRLRDLLLQAKEVHPADDDAESLTNALAALGKIVTTMIRIGSNEHPDVLVARELEGYWLVKASRLNEARDRFERVLLVRRQTYGDEHRKVLATRHNLYQVIGQARDAAEVAPHAAEAAKQFERLVEDQKRILGKDHADTQMSRDSLAYWSGMSGAPEKAVHIYTELLEDRVWQYGSIDERTLDTQGKLASWAGHAGNAAQARDIYMALIINWTEVQGSEGRNVERSKKNRDYWTRRVQNEGSNEPSGPGK